MKLYGYIALLIIVIALLAGGVWYARAPHIQGTYHAVNNASTIMMPQEKEPLKQGKHIVIHLSRMTLDLRDGTTTLQTVPIISIGKPGSYYETIGGTYANDYKIREHFSSIGHVYMPWSTHVFGNFFIHGIPYYPDGKEVSSEYSGGCIRLANDDAKRVYEFVETGTPIIIFRDAEEDFIPTATTTEVNSMDMTRLMIAVISLEVLSQDNPIHLKNGETTTRRALLPQLLIRKDDSVGSILANDRGEDVFISYMNHKAESLGMAHTRFSSLTERAQTTSLDIDRFTMYITTYKHYLVPFMQSTAVSQ
jgi:hypothetical protein